jgi:hypothetical protein
MMRDLCEEGFAMRAMMPLHVGDITPFTLQLDAITRLEGQCQVVWVKEDGRLIGLHFIDNSSKIRGQIRSWLALPEEIQSPENQAAPVEPHQPATMDELREEMRSIGSREESPHREKSTRQPSSRPESNREDSPSEELFISSPPLPDPVPDSVQAAPASQVEAPLPEPAVLPETPIPSLPPLEPAKRVPPWRTEPATSSQHNEFLGLFSPAQNSETSSPFPSLAPSLEPLSILEKRNIPRDASSSWLDNFTLSSAIGSMLCIALLIGGFVFHDELGQLLIWLGQKMSGTESVQPLPPAAAQNSAPAAPAQPQENSSSRTPRSDSPAANSTPATGADNTSLAENLPNRQNSAGQTLATPQKQSQIPPALTPLAHSNKPGPAPANSAPTVSSTAPEGAAEPGGQEFQAARSILRSQNREAEVPDAVRLLWAAIEKGSTSAEVTLAELYRTGRGVRKNCDQTRILLTAAANRGNPEAKRQLANFMAEGCR